MSHNGSTKINHDSEKISKGTWINGVLDGDNVELDSPKYSYSGAIRNGHKHGKGKFTWKDDGSIYDGMWKNDKRHQNEGRCEMIYSDGSVYSGTFIDKCREGFGKMTYKSGEMVYQEGYWSRGLLVGQGKIVYRDGTYFKGRFRNSKRHGFGEEFIGDRGWGISVRKGNWQNDELIN